MILFAELHTHTDIGSNARLIDSTCKVGALIDTAIEMGHVGIAITDHESLSAHIKAIRKAKEVRNKHPDFKLVLGNEVYLINESDHRNTDKFWHFLLLAKDHIGHRQLRELSTRAWRRVYTHKRVERVPTFYSDLADVIQKARGHLIASTACLGSYFDALILDENYDAAAEFVRQMQSLFTEDGFFVEIQPGLTEDQITYNKRAIPFCKEHGVPWIVTNDVHYLTQDKTALHAAFLNSKDEEREVEQFYESTYLKTEDEMRARLSYLPMNDISAGFENTVRIIGQVEQYDLAHEVAIPSLELPPCTLRHLFLDYYEQYPYIKAFAYSQQEQDRYCLARCEEGFINRHQPFDEEHLGRLNVELEQLFRISQQKKQSLSAYYNLTRWAVDLMWADDKGGSIVGPGRGSAGAFYICYLMDITQVNPIEWDLPWWRHISAERPELPDIDLDTSAARRPYIMSATKKEWGENRCLNIITFRTAAPKAAIQTACRGLGIDSDISRELSSYIPIERGKAWSIRDCLYGSDDGERRPIGQFRAALEKYPMLTETALEVESLVVGRSSHASGIYLFKEDFLNQNSLMKAPKGLEVTCWDQEDSDYVGALKLDYLTVEALDKIHKTMALLLESQKIDWQGSLKETFNHYFHPDVLEYDAPEMWNMLAEGSIIDLFQFQTQIGAEAIQKIKPKSLKEMALSSSVMRLMGDGDINPIDRYVEFKENPQLWYTEMHQQGLNENEIHVLERTLKANAGCSIEQEDVMRLSMDENICGFGIKEAHGVRKTIAKKKLEQIVSIKEQMFDTGRKRGTREQLLNYVWDFCVKPQLGYAFSSAHTIAYSMMGLIEMNLAYRFPLIHWNAACLTVNASANEDIEENKSTDYGKIATAIGDMQSRGVVIALPDINTSSFEFKPDEEKGQIIFGLKGIQGIGDEVAHQIISHRPYVTIQGFCDANVDMGIGNMVVLAKAGCFDGLMKGGSDEERRVNAVREIIRCHTLSKVELKTKLTMSNFPMIVRVGVLPPEFEGARKLLNFKAYVFSSEFRCDEISQGNKKTGWYFLDAVARTYFEDHLRNNFTYSMDYREEDGRTLLSQKAFTKYLNEEIEPLKVWMSDERTLRTVNKAILNDYARTIWTKFCDTDGGISHWEMDALNFYYHEHELEKLSQPVYGLSDWEAIPDEPVEIGMTGRSPYSKYPKYKLFTLAGTVLDKNATRHMVDLLTPTGVVTVKFWRDAFTDFNKQVSVMNKDTGKKEVIDKSWFSRGTRLVVTGYRRGDTFYPKRHYDSTMSSPVGKIESLSCDGTTAVIRYKRNE